MGKDPKHKRLLWLKTAGSIVLLFLLIVVSYFWWQHKSNSQTYKGPVDKVSTGLIGEYASLIFVAQEKGYFKANGLDVTIRDFSSGPEALADLLAGNVDMAMASDFAGVRNSFNNENFKILANMSKANAFYMIARQDHKISEEADLKNKKIGITRKSVGEFYLGQFLTFNHLKLQDVTVIDLKQPELIDKLNSGQIDAAVLFEPNAYQAAKLLGNNATRFSVQTNESIYTLLYASDKLVREKPEATKRYMKAVVQAEKFIEEHDNEARAIVARHLNYDDDYINYIWPKFSFAASLDQELLINMDDEARWVIENGLVPNSKIPNYLRLVYFGGLEATKPEAITIIR